MQCHTILLIFIVLLPDRSLGGAEFWIGTMPGFRQRWNSFISAGAAGPHDEDQPVFATSALITRLLLQYTCGVLSAAELCRLAHAAVVDGCEHIEVYKFASLGSWGQYPANGKRDIDRLLDASSLPEPTIVRVPCLDTRSNPALVMHDDMGIMEPHLWIAALADHAESEPLLGLSCAEEFWNSVSPNDPKLLAAGGHPMLQVAGWKELFIPLWLHGDGVEYSENDSLQVYTCGSCLTSSNSMLTMLYISSFVKSVTCVMAAHGADTWNEAWVIINWSFQALWEGKHPITDAFGEPWPIGSKHAALAGQQICNGKRFCVWNLTGDLEYFANTLGMSHWRSHEFCWCCNVSKVDLNRNWKINWHGRGWALRDPLLFHMVSRKSHGVFQLPGVTSWNVCFDSLHVIDNKGIGSHIAGSVLHDMVYTNQPGQSPQNRLAAIWRRSQEIYDALAVPSRLTSLQLSMLNDPSKPHATYPALHAKAADCRHFIPVLAQIALEQHDGSEASSHRVSVLKHLARFHAICDEEGQFMSTGASQDCLVEMEGVLSHYAWLHWTAESAGRLLYNMVPKFHYAWHLAYDARWMNPRFKWTYKAESWIGHVSHIGSSCAHGTRVTKISVPLGYKYRLYVYVRLSRSVYDEF